MTAIATDRDRDYRDRYDRDQRNNRNNASFSGVVSNVRSGNSFDLRANGRTYNVYTSSGSAARPEPWR